ncbi:hypothetical protein JHK87_024259 [Glycine soja]|nr:hypothetical protein JHK87_024259 [Glycine soja]
MRPIRGSISLPSFALTFQSSLLGFFLVVGERRVGFVMTTLSLTATFAFAHIENEYGEQSKLQGAAGQNYENWTAKMAVEMGTGVSWVMCKEDDALDLVPVNIGSDEMVSMNEMVEIILGFENKNIPIHHIPGPEGVRGRNSDSTLIKEKLGWAPTMRLKGNDVETAAYYIGAATRNDVETVAYYIGGFTKTM